MGTTLSLNYMRARVLEVFRKHFHDVKFPQIALRVAKSRQAGDNIRILVTMAARS